MDITPIADFAGLLIGAGIGIPLIIQWVNMVSQRMHASNLQQQVNDNTALNNTSIQGTAGNQEVADTPKKI